MDRPEKLRLLAECDFSWWREQKRIGYAHQEGAIGFGSALHGIYSGLSNIADDIKPESGMKTAMLGYEILRSRYERIPWGKIDRSDPDFGFLFEFMDGLERLGEKLQSLEVALQSGAVSVQSPEFVSAIEEAEGLNGKNYRRDVLRKYGIDLSEPQSNQ